MFKGHRLLQFGVVVLIFTAIVFSSCASEPAATTLKEPIKVGILLDKTGPIAFTGLDAEKGLDIGFEEIGYQFEGRPIVVIKEDAASDAGPSLDKAKKLVEQDKVNIVMGPVNGAGDQAVFHYLSEVGIPRIAMQPMDVPDDWDRSKPYTSFAVRGTGQSMAYVMGAYAYEVLGYRTTTILTCDFIAGHLFTEGFGRGFTAKGGKVLNQVFYPFHATQDMVPYYLQLDKNADCLCAWWPGSDCFIGVKAYKDLGLKIPIVQPEDGGLMASETALKEMGSAAVGMVSCSIYTYTNKNPGNDKFVEMFREKYNEAPGPFSGAAYANVQILMETLKSSGGDTSPKALIKALRGLDIMTVGGPVKFPDPEHNVGTTTPMIFKINAKLEPEVLALPIVNEKWTPGGGRLQDQYLVEWPK